MLEMAAVKAGWLALRGGAKMWFLLAILAAGAAIGGFASWKIASAVEAAKWTKQFADTNTTLNETTKAIGDALTTSEQLRADQIRVFNVAVQETHRINGETQKSVTKVLNRIGGITDALHEVEKRALVLAVGLCNFDPAADGLREEAYRAAFPIADPGSGGRDQAGSEHARDRAAAAADAARGASARRASASGDTGLRAGDPGGR